MIAASRPSTRPSASISTQFFSMSDGLAEKVFIARDRMGGGRNAARSAQAGVLGCALGRVKEKAFRFNALGDVVLRYLQGCHPGESRDRRCCNNGDVRAFF